MLVVGKGAASGKEEGKFSALLAPRQPDWVASQGCRKSQLHSKLLDLGEKGVYSSYTYRKPLLYGYSKKGERNLPLFYFKGRSPMTLRRKGYINEFDGLFVIPTIGLILLKFYISIFRA
ncbi:hypothetical protein MOW08_15530 (plasmid) [Acinetobacter schindleri]|nr:hypothetical protein MOW08_15530 [Acinetobacter schindleri]